MTRESKRTEGQFLAQRVVSTICAKPIALPCGEIIKVTASVGWAAYPWQSTPSDLSTTEDILKVADRALYLAKKTGKNRAVGVLPIERDEDKRLDNQADCIPENLALEEGKTIRLIQSAETLSLV
jgi:predicted signal transduction protein with EAL and GGDEF domain